MARVDPKRLATGRRLGTPEAELEYWVRHVERFCATRGTLARSGPVRVSELAGSVALDDRDFRTLLTRLAHNGLVYLFGDQARPAGQPERRKSVRVPAYGDVHYVLWLGGKRGAGKSGPE